MGNVFYRAEIRQEQEPRRPPTLEEARAIGDELYVNWEYVSAETLHKGTLVEMEHGLVNLRTNVTNDDWVMTAKIALAHINEHPLYYELLESMEKDLKSRVSPAVSLFLSPLGSKDV